MVGSTPTSPYHIERGDRDMARKRVKQETCQCPGSFVWENLLNLSKDFTVPVTVECDNGERFIGIFWRLLTDHREHMMYLRLINESTVKVEHHVCVNIDHVVSVKFNTEPGILEDVWNIA